MRFSTARLIVTRKARRRSSCRRAPVSGSGTYALAKRSAPQQLSQDVGVGTVASPPWPRRRLCTRRVHQGHLQHLNGQGARGPLAGAGGLHGPLQLRPQGSEDQKQPLGGALGSPLAHHLAHFVHQRHVAEAPAKVRSGVEYLSGASFPWNFCVTPTAGEEAAALITSDTLGHHRGCSRGFGVTGAESVPEPDFISRVADSEGWLRCSQNWNTSRTGKVFPSVPVVPGGPESVPASVPESGSAGSGRMAGMAVQICPRALSAVDDQNDDQLSSRREQFRRAR